MAQRRSLWSRQIASPVTSPCSLPDTTCSKNWASRLFQPQLLNFSQRKHRPPFWCVKCLEQSLSSRRRAPSQNLPPLENASVSVTDGAREGSPSVRQGPRLSPSLA